MDFMPSPAPEPRRILVRATNWLGDAILCLPALQALRRAHPKAHIAILGFPWLKDLYTGEGFCDDVLPYPAARGLQSLAAKRAVARQLRALQFDTAVLFQNAFEAAAIAALARIQRRVGYNRDARGWLLTSAIPVPKPGESPAHERFYYLELLRRSGLIAAYGDEPVIQFQRAPQLRERGRERLGSNVIGVCPGAAFGGAKRWYPDRFAAAAAQIVRVHGGTVALFGSPEESPITEIVAAHLQREGIAVENFAGRTKLTEFLELAAACRLMLTNDSGAMHVAYAVGTPSVTVFGSTDHIGTGPVGPHARIVREPVECSPCKLRECPIDHRCMLRVTPEAVAQVGLELLK
jgi:heptosyltransferase II